MLNQLPEGFTALVLGASGGIGHALLEALLASPRPGRIVAVSRRKIARDDPRLESLTLDVTTGEGLETLAVHLQDMPLHLVFNAVGMLHDDDAGIAPEKRLEDLDFASLERLFHVNAATPAMLLKTLRHALKGKHPVIFASLSARVGSIDDNGLGGWYAYRASKAAHNMLLKTAAVELRRLNRHAIVLCLHPGTTDTALSQPFQARVPEGKLFTADFVAERLLEVMSQRTPDDSGSFWDWAGDPVPW
ncbi:NAD(P)-dependent dehydrogenase, short-chain alcohol dehydrogenase family [Modicisalibacter ilicicola DSM 19980]|uniref:NAD(P)-dependent dehydrogenase, short-chain alcohol dehydrogenase family n=1 Tax=Modicisalibacter ilicicola DSM 19980 TaxID=1121942 RepID=A0A1M4Y513_9GAMM|nr:SDR family NAD(P)-dependent oxidoreductase [Halomonas ilicicola]SHF00907.1 NAD(P)-dependent dehydrogenase, short-chain alcohol dehydrogenase family [Halomonas ilicicola DSM 19980]